MTEEQKQQDQTKIPLQDKNGDNIGVAIRTGNNAAWLCVCGYRLPLIWTKFPPAKAEWATVCSECHRKYKGEGAPDTILEIEK